MKIKGRIWSKIQIYLIGGIFILFSTNAFSQIRENLRNEIETIISYETEINTEKIPAFQVAVIIKDSVYYFNFGDQKFLDSTGLNENSYFEIGSLTSIFTALLTLEMENEGVLSRDDLFNTFLPESYRNNACSISLYHLLTHTSGFPFRPKGFGLKELDARNPYAYYTKDDLLGFYADQKDLKNGKYLFSNVNYALLEIALEEVSKKSFSELFESRITKPLNLNHTGFHPDFHEIVTGFSVGGNRIKPWTFQSFEGAIGLKSSLSDLAKFVKCNFKDYHGELEKSFQELRQMQFPTGRTKNTMVGLGWHGVQFKKYHPLIALGGVTGGHGSFISLVPETQTGVVILSTAPCEMDGLGFLILRMINHNWKLPKGD
ncbi:MAG: serine hydrolase domain-containing protein [Saprospiraceae bacterium]